MARTIKRYDNRKLYDTEASCYVSQKDLAELVRAGETIEVVDNSTGEDLTAQTLTQIILEEGKEGGGRDVLPTDLLHRLLRRGGTALDQVIGGGARQVGQSLSQVKSGLDEFARQSLSHLNRLTPGAAAPGDDEQETSDAAAARPGEVDALREQLTRLEARLEDLLDRVDEDGGRRTADDGPLSTTDEDPAASS